MDLKFHGAQSAFHREEQTQDQKGWANTPKVRYCPVFWLPPEISQLTLPLLESEVRVVQSNPKIRSVINASVSHLLFYCLENALLNLSGDTDWDQKNMCFPMSGKPGVTEYPLSGERWGHKSSWSTDRSWAVCEILASWKQTKGSGE